MHMTQPLPKKDTCPIVLDETPPEGEQEEEEEELDTRIIVKSKDTSSHPRKRRMMIRLYLRHAKF